MSPEAQFYLFVGFVIGGGIALIGMSWKNLMFENRMADLAHDFEERSHCEDFGSSMAWRAAAGHLSECLRTNRKVDSK